MDTVSFASDGSFVLLSLFDIFHTIVLFSQWVYGSFAGAVAFNVSLLLVTSNAAFAPNDTVVVPDTFSLSVFLFLYSSVSEISSFNRSFSETLEQSIIKRYFCEAVIFSVLYLKETAESPIL